MVVIDFSESNTLFWILSKILRGVEVHKTLTLELIVFEGVRNSLAGGGVIKNAETLKKVYKIFKSETDKKKS